jgi:hypothetical protein
VKSRHCFSGDGRPGRPSRPRFAFACHSERSEESLSLPQHRLIHDPQSSLKANGFSRAEKSSGWSWPSGLRYHVAVNVHGGNMDFDQDKVDDMVLALLFLTAFRSQGILRAWKGHDWETLGRLSSKGYISDPKSKARSVQMTEEGASRSQQLFEKYFGTATQRKA